MSAVVVCLNCAHYQKGGYCRKKRRDIGALNPACEKALAPDHVPEEKVEKAKLETERRCTKCRQILPLSEFEYTRSNKGEKIKRKICKTCYHESMSKKKDITKTNEDMNTTTQETTTVQTKTCICCGETKPLTEFYRDKKATDGHQSYCKRCLNLRSAERARKARAEKRAAKAQDTQQTVVVRETLTDQQMVEALRARGWEVTCKRTITEEL